MRHSFLARLVAGAVVLASPPALRAQSMADSASPDWGVKGQWTYIGQRKNSFRSPYAGTNSLSAAQETSYAFSATAFVGVRVPVLGELYINPEVIQGRPLSGLVGLGSFSNGEMQKVAGSNPSVYLPRLFLRRDWAFGDESEAVAAAPNQLAGRVATRRLRLTVGKFAVTDVFDANRYSHDARTQFLTWASLAHGAFDFAADAQGYTQGAAVEWVDGDWAVRAGRFMVPRESNGRDLDRNLSRVHGDQVEVERRHELAGREGAVRLLAFRNQAVMGSFADATAQAVAQGGGAVPALAGVRRLQTKSGWGLHVEQEITATLGGFLRWSQGDGRTESYSFEEVDSSAQIGLSMAGAAWDRPGDTVGLLAIQNGLSVSHRDYLARGGIGYFIGDGRLRYAPERILEAYYSWRIAPATTLSLDLQRYWNPAYNADRGPVNLAAVRAHMDF